MALRKRFVAEKPKIVEHLFPSPEGKTKDPICGQDSFARYGVQQPLEGGLNPYQVGLDLPPISYYLIPALNPWEEISPTLHMHARTCASESWKSLEQKKISILPKSIVEILIGPLNLMRVRAGMCACPRQAVLVCFIPHLTIRPYPWFTSFTFGQGQIDHVLAHAHMPACTNACYIANIYECYIGTTSDITIPAARLRREARAAAGILKAGCADENIRSYHTETQSTSGSEVIGPSNTTRTGTGIIGIKRSKGLLGLGIPTPNGVIMAEFNGPKTPKTPFWDHWIQFLGRFKWEYKTHITFTAIPSMPKIKHLVAVVPDPPRLTPELSEYDRVKRLYQALNHNLRVHNAQITFGSSYDKKNSKFYKHAAIGAAALIEEKIPPAEWIEFSLWEWKRIRKTVCIVCPPYAWLFSEKRIMTRGGAMTWNSVLTIGRIVTSQTYDLLMKRYTAMQRRLESEAYTLEDARRIADECFPGALWERLIDRCKQDKEIAERDLADRIARGEFLWK